MKWEVGSLAVEIFQITIKIEQEEQSAGCTVPKQPRQCEETDGYTHPDTVTHMQFYTCSHTWDLTQPATLRSTLNPSPQSYMCRVSHTSSHTHRHTPSSIVPHTVAPYCNLTYVNSWAQDCVFTHTIAHNQEKTHLEPQSYIISLTVPYPHTHTVTHTATHCVICTVTYTTTGSHTERRRDIHPSHTRSTQP